MSIAEFIFLTIYVFICFSVFLIVIFQGKKSKKKSSLKTTKKGEIMSIQLNYDDELNEIIDHYGLNHQLVKAVEEPYELIEVIDEIRTQSVVSENLSPDLRARLKTEIADVKVILRELELMFEFSQDEIQREELFKILRTQRQIEIEKSKEVKKNG